MVRCLLLVKHSQHDASSACAIIAVCSCAAGLAAVLLCAQLCAAGCCTVSCIMRAESCYIAEIALPALPCPAQAAAIVDAVPALFSCIGCEPNLHSQEPQL